MSSITSALGTTSAPTTSTTTVTTTSLPPWATSRSSSTSGNYSPGSFVGNTPLTVLFFLALAVGGVIACLFLFFTLRYFVRSRYGMHIYPLTYGLLFQGGGRRGRQSTVVDYTDEELVFMSRLHFLHADLWERRLFERRRRRRRGGRFSRMAKLTEEQVETLFPKKTYRDWLNSGKDNLKNDLDGILHEEKDTDLDSSSVEKTKTTTVITTAAANNIHPVASNSANSTHQSRKTIVANDDLEMQMGTEPTKSKTFGSDGIDMGESSLIPESSQGSDSGKTEHTHSEGIELLELHFSSGSCAICLEQFDDDDEVRGLICGHVFHSECLDPWLTKRRACCPMCKRDYFYNGDAAATNSGDDASSVPAEGGRTSRNSNSNEEQNATDNHNNNHNNDEDNNNDNDNNSNDNENSNNNNNNNNSNNNSNANTTEEDDEPVFDLELVRNDPALRAILQQLITTEERARMILEAENIQQTDIEARANEIADRKYNRFGRFLWWKLMGIKRLDLFNWTVVCLYHEFRANNPLPDPIGAASASTETRNPQPESRTRRSTDDVDASESNGAATPTSVTTTTSATLEPSGANSHGSTTNNNENAISAEGEVDLAEVRNGSNRT